MLRLGGRDVVQNISLARRLLALLGKSESLLSFVQDRPGHDRRYAMTSRKIKNELGWMPEISLDAGLRQTIDWYKNSGSWLAAVRGGDYRTCYAITALTAMPRCSPLPVPPSNPRALDARSTSPFQSSPPA